MANYGYDFADEEENEEEPFEGEGEEQPDGDEEGEAEGHEYAQGEEEGAPPMGGNQDMERRHRILSGKDEQAMAARRQAIHDGMESAGWKKGARKSHSPRTMIESHPESARTGARNERNQAMKSKSPAIHTPPMNREPKSPVNRGVTNPGAPSKITTPKPYKTPAPPEAGQHQRKPGEI